MTATEADDIEAQLAEVAPLILEHFNQTHEDSLVLVATGLGGRSGVSRARAIALDTRSMTLAVTSGQGDEELTFSIEEPITSLDGVTHAALAMVAAARAVVGGEPDTSAERIAVEMQAIRTFVTEVRAVRDVHPHLREITVGGVGLDTFSPLGPDTFLYVLVPPRGRTELTVDESFSWEAYEHMPAEERPGGAYYTIRRWRPETREIDMLFVLHGDEGSASAWAIAAQPGDPVALWGPRESWKPPAGTTHHLLVADETGLPAAAAIVEHLGRTQPDAPVTVVAEVASPAEHQEVPARPGVDVRWTYRGDAPAGTTSGLVDTVAELDLDVDGLYVWGGAESRCITQVRKLLRRERGAEREQVMLVGYWRHADTPVDLDDGDA